MGRSLLLSLLLLGAFDARAGEGARWLAAGQIEVQPAAALPGVLGVGGGVRLRRMAPGALFWDGRIGLVSASASNEVWRIDHRQLVAEAGAGVRAVVGVGEAWGRAGVGGAFVYETLTRHQAGRLAGIGVADTARTAGSGGPWLTAEVGCRLELRDGWSFLLTAGPAVSWQTVGGAFVRRLGAAASLGVARVF